MSPRTKGLAYIAAAALCWSTGGIGIKAVSDSALTVTFYRSLFAGIAQLLFLGRGVLGRRRWRSSGVLAVAIFSFGALLPNFVWGTNLTNAAHPIFPPSAPSLSVLSLSPSST